MRAEFPAKSPMVGLNCARAIFMLALQNTVVTDRLQTPQATLCRAGVRVAPASRRRFPPRGRQNKRLPSRNPGAFESRNLKLLNAERAAAPASALHIGVVELEPGALDRLDIVDFHAFQV